MTQQTQVCHMFINKFNKERLDTKLTKCICMITFLFLLPLVVMTFLLCHMDIRQVAFRYSNYHSRKTNYLLTANCTTFFPSVVLFALRYLHSKRIKVWVNHFTTLLPLYYKYIERFNVCFNLYL